MDGCNPKLEAKHYKSDVTPIWCPGCGHFGIQAAINRAHPEVPVRRLDMASVAHVPWREARDAVITAIGEHLQTILPGKTHPQRRDAERPPTA